MGAWVYRRNAEIRRQEGNAMNRFSLGASIAVLAAATLALPVAAQQTTPPPAAHPAAAAVNTEQRSIAADRSYESPLPFFRDLGPWDPNYRAPRAADGHADIQGVWSSASLTTMTRSGPGGGQGAGVTSLEIPAERIAQLTNNSYYNQRLQNDNRRTEETAGAGDGKGGGDVKGYNNFWIDPGSEYGRVNGQWRSSWITSPANGQVPYTAQGRAMRGQRMQNFRTVSNTGPEIRPAGERCIISFGSQAGPPLTNAMYNNNYQIVQTPNAVVIDVEMNHDARIIRMRDTGPASTPRPASVSQWFGDSLGHWEGETLVVETRNVYPLQNQIGAFPLSPEGSVVEKFTRVSENELFYQFTVTDPVYYSQPWSGEIPLRKSTERLFEYACHEGNYALPGILRGDAQGRDTAIDQDGE
jgi:hypothetical protein